MDTRTKILTLDQAAGLPAAGLLVTGYFDPLLRAHAERLAEIADGVPVTVLLGEPPEPLLPQSARAELAAALRCVRHVVPLGEIPFSEAVARFPHASIAPMEAFDLEHRESLLKHIRLSHQAPARP